MPVSRSCDDADEGACGWPDWPVHGPPRPIPGPPWPAGGALASARVPAFASSRCAARLHAFAIAVASAACPARPPETTPPPADDTTPAHRPARDEFDGAAALQRVSRMMTWPRMLGDPGRTRSIDALADELAAVGADEVIRVPHEAVGPDGTSSYALVELVAHVHPLATRRFVLASHFDTRPWADEEPDVALRDRPVPGANDGTSGVAVVLELVPLLARQLPQDVGISVILFDGEELGRPGLGGYCMGSRHLALAIAAGEHPLLAGAELGIVLDMVGDEDLRIPVEPYSRRVAPALVEHVWATAAELGVAQFDPMPRERAILDDHRFLSEAGIPSILLIDRDYASWHRTSDTVDKVAAESLAAVGEVVRVSVLRWFATGTTRGTLRP